MKTKTYRYRFTRYVTRQVSLRQEAFAYIEAPDEKTARDAAWEIATDLDEQDSHLTDWEDDNASRQASNDEPELGPLGISHYAEVVKSAPVTPASAIKLLNLDESEFS